MPRLAVFPKAFMDELCVTGTMTIRQWIELAATLDIDGLEFYHGLSGAARTGSMVEPLDRLPRIMAWRFRCCAVRPTSRTPTRVFASSKSINRSIGSTLCASSAGNIAACSAASVGRKCRATTACASPPSASQPACRTPPSVRRDADPGKPLQGQLLDNIRSSPSRWTIFANWSIASTRRTSA